MRKNTASHDEFFHRFRIALSISLLVSIIVCCGTVYTKYKTVITVPDLVTAEAAEIYFESNLLVRDGATSYTVRPGAAVSLELRNWPDSERYSTVDIAYEVSGTGGITVSFGGEGTLVQDTRDTDTLTLTMPSTEGIYTVTASCSKYNISLSASFNVTAVTPEASVQLLSVDEDKTVYEFTVVTGNQKGTVTVDTLPSGLTLITDLSSAVLSEYSSMTLQFRAEGGTFTASDIAGAIKVGDITATAIT